MIKNIDLTLVSNDDDWEVLYINGVSVSEGHRIDVLDILSTYLHNMNVNIKFNKFIVESSVFEEEDYTLLENIENSLDRVY